MITEVEAVCVNMRYVLFLHFGFFNILKISVIHIMKKKRKEEGGEGEKEEQGECSASHGLPRLGLWQSEVGAMPLLITSVL